MMKRVMAIDPGEVRTGLAICDPTRTIARPLKVIHAGSRRKLAEEILRLAAAEEVGLIIVGLALDLEGEAGPQARRALRLAEMLKRFGEIPVETWDESGSTLAARQGGRKDPMLDARAAAFILQDYLDAHQR